ncbi:MAG: succinate dehydrogenase [Nitrososphaerales archaeon]
MFRESSIRLLHYATGVLIAVFGAVHLATHSFLGVEGYADSLRYLSVIGRYKDPLFAFTLEALLVTVAYHGLNGTRVILLEFRQGERWDRVVTWLLVAVGILVVAYGTRTVLGVYFLG